MAKAAAKKKATKKTGAAGIGTIETPPSADTPPPAGPKAHGAKTEQIRKLLTENPKLKDKEIQEQVGCSLPLVSNVRRDMKGGKKKARGGADGGGIKRGPKTSTNGQGNVVRALGAASELIKAVGGIDEAIKYLEIFKSHTN